MSAKIDYEDLLKRGIVAMEPGYRDGIGDATRLILDEDELVIEKNIKTVIKNLAKVRFLDLAEERRYFRELLAKGRNLPLAYGKDYIFLPVKTRMPIGKNDGAMSFVNAQRIESAKDGLIRFKNGKEIRVYTSDRTMRGLVKDARIIKKDFERDF